jgi:hypothetical protein
MAYTQIASIRSDEKSRFPFFALLKKVTPFLSHPFVVVTVLAIFVPLNPKMPSRGLDASWEFAMNEAVARHLSFGRDIVFTYGPYASIGTRRYHPATDVRMMLGSLCIAGSFLAGLRYLSGRNRPYLKFSLLLFLVTFGNPELILLAYSFLLAVCILKWLNCDQGGRVPLNWQQLLAVAVMWSTLGLLPLVKGSLLLPFVATAVIPSTLLLYHSRIRQAFFLLLLPLTASIALWLIAGQRIANLPAFLRGTALLTSGYTEAMSTSWLILPGKIGAILVFAFCSASVLLFISIFRAAQMRSPSRWILALLCAVFLLVIFKHGFVKADALPSAFFSLTALIIIVGFLNIDRYFVSSLSIAMVLTVATSGMQDHVLASEVHQRFGSGVTWGGVTRQAIFDFCLDRAPGAYARTTYKNTWNTYVDAWNGIQLRLSSSNALKDQFEIAIATIKRSYAMPELKGSADIYTFDQAILLASNNEWDPRPVLQSYSAYTPELARMDELHLRGLNAPDWVLFQLQTIDERLPSLDDGSSWAALLDNYTVVSFDGQFALMRKRPVTKTESEFGVIYKQVCKTGGTVTLPQTDGTLFAEVTLKPTFAGRVLTALFNPPQLHAVLGLGDGKTERYRVVSNMMKTGFVLSPFVGSTEQFASLAEGSKNSRDVVRVETISISPSYGGSLFWSDTYELTIKKYIGN